MLEALLHHLDLVLQLLLDFDGFDLLLRDLARHFFLVFIELGLDLLCIGLQGSQFVEDDGQVAGVFL